MKIVIDIPDEQVKKSLEESKYINEDEGVKGSVNIVMLYTNARLEFVDVERKTDFYSCEYKILPKGHGKLKDENEILNGLQKVKGEPEYQHEDENWYCGLIIAEDVVSDAETIIPAESEEEE